MLDNSARLDSVYQKVHDSPLFGELVRNRNRFAVVLSVIVLGVYYAFVFFASQPAAFSAPVTEGSKWPIGLLIGWAIQAFAFLMTGIYVNRANSDFDVKARQLIEEASR